MTEENSPSTRDKPCRWSGGTDVLTCQTCGLEYDYRKCAEPPCPLFTGEDYDLTLLDGNEIWETLFSIMKGNVPEELNEQVCAELAERLMRAFAKAEEASKYKVGYYDLLKAYEALCADMERLTGKDPRLPHREGDPVRSGHDDLIEELRGFAASLGDSEGVEGKLTIRTDNGEDEQVRRNLRSVLVEAATALQAERSARLAAEARAEALQAERDAFKAEAERQEDAVENLREKLSAAEARALATQEELKELNKENNVLSGNLVKARLDIDTLQADVETWTKRAEVYENDLSRLRVTLKDGCEQYDPQRHPWREK